jgi:hypothetical protein
MRFWAAILPIPYIMNVRLTGLLFSFLFVSFKKENIHIVEKWQVHEWIATPYCMFSLDEIKEEKI